MTTTGPSGRRERKKAATRQAIADAAWELFSNRGFDAVSVREVADVADVSTTTLFNYFPSKEALVFDRSDDIEISLAAAVRRTPSGASILDSLRDYAVREWLPVVSDPRMREFEQLVEGTPSLRYYREQMWLRHAGALAAAVAAQLGRDPHDLHVAALARFILDTPTLIRGRLDPAGAVDEIFSLLRDGCGTLKL